MKKIFFYGSFKRNEFNYNRLSLEEKTQLKYLHKQDLPGFTLYDTGNGYPVAIKDNRQHINGEVFEIGESLFQRILRIEVASNYTLDCIDNMFIFWMRKNCLDTQFLNLKHIGPFWTGR
jgi:gamma-glutamylcyclotransferase (GGCT)/AIG2-like uncharacterized protein YtfP